MTPDTKIEELDLPAWVARAPQGQRGFREAVHIVLTAISTSAALRSKMVMKGGLLLAIRYDSTRFTKDADFSTRELYTPGAETELLAELDRQLVIVNDRLQYDTMCRRQKTEIRPKRADATFPTLSLGIGYAPRSNARALERLLSGQMPSVVEIDYSYNEAVLDIDVLALRNGEQLQAYSFLNLLAEKMRSLLQQPVRQRNRRQDVYDLNLLLSGCGQMDAAEQLRLLDQLMRSCAERGIAATSESMADPQVRDLAAKDYDGLAAEVDGKLPPFDDAYELVQRFYTALPWPKLKPQSAQG